MDAILPGESNFAPIEQYRKMAEISVEHHGSRLAIVSGHNRCAGNPCTDERHNGHIHKAVETVRGWGLFETVIGVFVDPERDVHIAVPAEESVAVAA
jgi:hypothetical protein